MPRNQNIKIPDPARAQGTYACSGCGNTLFEACKKFEVGSGFPSFWAHIGSSVKRQALDTYGRNRVQLLCQSCGRHLGHLFHDARTPTHVRYCINAESVKFEGKS